jgi:proline iminopeptidase
MPRDSLFPPVEPHKTGLLPVDDIHTLYWEQCGRPDGVPVLFLHGGPGAGASPTHRRFFNPSHYRIVIFDQRGCGRSRPLGETRANTTDLLIGDIEALRRMLGIGRWHLFGGSWGSTLALAYAQAHPDRCLSITLRGIFLMRPSEIAWFLGGMKSLFPEVWRDFIDFLPDDERDDPLGAYHRRVMDPAPSIHMPAARSWSLYEGRCSTLLPNAEIVAHAARDGHALGLARLETHYFLHNLFAPHDRLLRDIGRLRHLPATIVQGRYDAVCPIETADALHRAWPEAAYVVVADAGHSAMEPGIRTALVDTMERMKTVAAVAA